MLGDILLFSDYGSLRALTILCSEKFKKSTYKYFFSEILIYVIIEKSVYSVSPWKLVVPSEVELSYLIFSKI